MSVLSSRNCELGLWVLLAALVLSACNKMTDTAEMPGATTATVAVMPIQQPQRVGEEPMVLRVAGEPVYATELRFWLNYMEKYYRESHGIAAIADWNVEQNGRPLRNFLRDSALSYICNNRAIETQARALGVKLSMQSAQEIDEQRAQNMRIYGGVSEYRRIVNRMYLSEGVFDYVTQMDYLSRELFAHLYGAQGEQCSDQCVSAYVQQQDFMAVRYIFLANPKGARGGAVKQQRQTLEKLLAQLKVSARPRELFGKLLTQYNQDDAMNGYPDGRLISTSAKSEAFVKAYRQLKYYQYSEIVADDQGLYLIMRMPILPGMNADAAGHSLRYWAAYQYLFKTQVSQWCAALPMEYLTAYEQTHADAETVN